MKPPRYVHENKNATSDEYQPIVERLKLSSYPSKSHEILAKTQRYKGSKNC